MTAPDELAELYAQWRVLTEQEEAGIRQGAWSSVDQCQTAKSRLQPRIEEVSRRVDLSLLEARFRPLVAELMAMEQRNAALVEEQRGRAQAQIREDNQSCRRLRKLQRLFIPPARLNWQSYS